MAITIQQIAFEHYDIASKQTCNNMIIQYEILVLSQHYRTTQVLDIIIPYETLAF